MIIKYSLDSWDGKRFLSGHICRDGETWQFFDPLVIVALMIGAARGTLDDAGHTEIELKDNSIELAVQWEDE